MGKYIKKHKIKIITGFAIFVVVPIGIKHISMIPGFSSTSNDWVGFWGSYIGAILGACVALYVLIETLKDNKRIQAREELVGFCNCITEKSSLFTQKYEETIYDVHTYLTIHEFKDSEEVFQSLTAEQKICTYKQFLANHHCAKAILFEIETLLSIRKDIEMFRTAKFDNVLQLANEAYEEFKEFETKVGNVSKISEVDDKSVIDIIERFLEALNLYLKELLHETKVENEEKMLSLKEIYNCAKKNKDIKDEVDLAEYYMTKFREEIDDNRSKLLVYKNRMNRKIDLEIPVFWMSTLAVILANVSAFVAILSGKTEYVTKISENGATAVFVLIMFMGVTLYQITMRDRKKYSLMRLALEEIEREMNNKLQLSEIFG